MRAPRSGPGRSAGSRRAISCATRSTPPVSRRIAARASMTTGALMAGPRAARAAGRRAGAARGRRLAALRRLSASRSAKVSSWSRSSRRARPGPRRSRTTSRRRRASRSSGSPPKAVRLAWAPVCRNARGRPEPGLDAGVRRAQAEVEVLRVHEDALVEGPEPPQRLGPGHEAGRHRPAGPARRARPPRLDRRREPRRQHARRARSACASSAALPGSRWALSSREPSGRSTSGTSSRSGSRSASRPSAASDASSSSTSGLTSAVTGSRTSGRPAPTPRPKPCVLAEHDDLGAAAAPAARQLGTVVRRARVDHDELGVRQVALERVEQPRELRRRVVQHGDERELRRRAGALRSGRRAAARRRRASPAAPRSRSARARAAAPSLRALQDLRQRARCGRRVAGRVQAPAVRIDELGRAARVGRHHRHPARERLGHDHPVRLALGAVEQAGGRGEQALGIVHARR